MSNRALRKLQGNDLLIPDLIESDSENESETIVQSKKSKKKKKQRSDVINPFELLNDDENDQTIEEPVLEDDVEADCQEPNVTVNDTKKKTKKKKKRKKKNTEASSDIPQEGEDEIDASLRMLNNGVAGEGDDVSVSRDNARTDRSTRALLMVEHKFLNSENELRRIFGSRVIREENTSRRRAQTRRKQKSSWMATPKDSWPPMGKTGLSMAPVKDTTATDGCQCFVFQHNHQYQQVQFQFYDAVESLNPQNIGNILQLQPYHIDGLIQLSEVFRMSEDLNMAAELIERALYSMELSFHPLFNMATGACRLPYKHRENRCMFIALFKHISSLGQRGCNRTALEYCKFLLSLDPDNDPVCVLLLIDYYAVRSAEYEYLIRMYNEWEAHRNLSQLPNFAFSLPLAMFHQDEENTTKADDLLQNSLLMFPGILVPLLDKCGVQGDSAASHDYFKTAEYSQPDALKQLLALYVGRSFSCWKVPEVMQWLERNVKLVVERIDNKDPLINTYKTRRESRYKGTPRNIYRHILMSEIPSVTATIPPDVASTVLSYDPLPPLDSVEAYSRPNRPNRAQTGGSALSMFLQSLLPNFNPNEPAEDAPRAEGGQAAPLRQGAAALMGAMRDMLNNIQMAEPPVDGQEGEDNPDREIEEWD